MAGKDDNIIVKLKILQKPIKKEKPIKKVKATPDQAHDCRANIIIYLDSLSVLIKTYYFN